MMSTIQTAVRVRPPLETNQTVEDVYVCPVTHTKQVIIGNQACFGADYVLPANCPQAYLYDMCIAKLINSLVEGHDVSIITFGKCKSGKTYSLIGPLNCFNEFSGIIPRASKHVFNSMSRLTQCNDMKYMVYVSFFEVLKGEIKDLLAFTNKNSAFPIPSNCKKSFNGIGIETVYCQSFNEVFNCLNVGMRTHFQNPNSSHSNKFFVITLYQQWTGGGKNYTKVSRATFGGLSSSPSIPCFRRNNLLAQTNNNKNSCLKTVSNILSIIAEGCCVVPGSSVSTLLASLLKDAIAFSYQSLLLCCLSPASIDHCDTLNCLNVIGHIRLLLSYQYDEQGKQDKHISPETLCDLNENDSIKGDAFGLEFAASQWQQLVENAEGLFQQLVQNGLSHDSKTQIEQWLCLKQECEDCFQNDSSFPVVDKIARSLERIDEVTESESKHSSCKSASLTESDNESIDEFDDMVKDETGDESSASKPSLKSKFKEKLEQKLNRFRNATELIVNKHIGCGNVVRLGVDQTATSGSYSSSSHNRRRRSVLAGEIFLQPSCSKNIPPNNHRKNVEIKEAREFRPIHTTEKNVASSSMPEKSIKKIEPITSASLTSENKNAISLLDTERENLFRHEITNLRDTRDILVEQRRSLDSKLNKEKLFTSDEERKFLEVDEAIEAIDAAIEHKNELLCGHSDVQYNSNAKEKGEIMLVDRLMKLSEPEMRCLLYKYFKKAVDLRESGRKMEQMLTDQEYQIETQTWKIQALCNALQQSRIESERRLVTVHREHKEKLHLIYRHYAQNSSGQSSSSSVSRFGDGNFENSEPPMLELPSSIGSSKTTHQNDLSIPQQNLKKLQGCSTHTTKVTRKKNKLIIQQQKSKKNTKI